MSTNAGSSECLKYLSESRRYSVGRGSHAQMKAGEVIARLAAAGVVRHLCSRTPTGGRWLAFSGEDGTGPRLKEREEHNSSVLKDDGAGEKPSA